MDIVQDFIVALRIVKNENGIVQQFFPSFFLNNILKSNAKQFENQLFQQIFKIYSELYFHKFYVKFSENIWPPLYTVLSTLFI